MNQSPTTQLSQNQLQTLEQKRSEIDPFFANLKIAVFPSDWFGCGFYRMTQPYTFLKRYFPYIDVIPYGTKMGINAADYDLIVFQRNFSKENIEFIKNSLKIGTKVIFDCDDNFFEIPKWSQARKFYPDDVLKVVDQIYREAAMIVVSTEYLKGYLKEHNDNIYVSPNRVHIPDEIPKDPDKTVIGWHGSYVHEGDFTCNTKLEKALKHVMKRYNVEIELLGHVPEMFKKIKHKFYPWAETISHLDNLNSRRWDIGLAIVQDNHFNRSKSNLKYLEYSACKTLTLASRVLPYEETIEDRVDGFLVNPTFWPDIIEDMVKNKEKRLGIIDNAYNKTKNQFSFSNDNMLNMFIDILHNVFKT